MVISQINTNDPLFDTQWNIKIMNVPRAWEYANGLGVKVAVIDSGIDGSHSDFGWRTYIDMNAGMSTAERKRVYQPVLDAIKNNTHPSIVGGWNFVDDDTDTFDLYRHGTYVSGIIGARDNEFGIIGVAPMCKLVPYKVIDANGYGDQINVINAINRAVDEGCHVANISLAFPYQSNQAEWEWAIKNAINNNLILLAATGNNNKKDVLYPACLEGVIAVGGCDELGQRWIHNVLLNRGSNYGAKMECICPAGSQPTTWFMRSRWTSIDGTSLGVANMSGLVALLRSKANINYMDVSKLISKYSSRSVLGFNIEEGYGVPDSSRMLSAILPEDVETAQLIKRLRVVKLELESIISELGG